MKRRIFLDTNIVIDYLSKRMPFGEEAFRVFSLPPRFHQLYTPMEFLQIPFWANDSNQTILNEPEVRYGKQ